MNTFMNPAIDASAMVARELRRSVRSIDAMVTALAIPVAILLVFTQIFGGAIDRSGGYIGYVVPGILVLCAGYGAAGTAAGVAQDMTSGTIDRFKTMPIFGPSVLVGHVIASVIRNLVASVLVLTVAIAIGFRPDAAALDWLGALAILTCYVIAMTWVACAVGLVLGVEAANSVASIMLFLPYLSSGFVMTTTMPEWLGPISEHQPLTPIIESMRAFLGGTPVGNDGWIAIAWCLAIGTSGFLAATRLFARRTTA